MSDETTEKSWETQIAEADTQTLSNEQLETIFRQLPPEWAEYCRECAQCLRRRQLCPDGFGFAFPHKPTPKISEAFASLGKALERALDRP